MTPSRYLNPRPVIFSPRRSERFAEVPESAAYLLTAIARSMKAGNGGGDGGDRTGYDGPTINLTLDLLQEGLTLFATWNQYSYETLQAAREALEMQIACLAAQRRSLREQRLIEEALDAVSADPIDADGVANTRLHRALGQAAHSPVLSSLHDVLLEKRTACLKRTFYDAGVTADWTVANDIHRRLVRAVRDRDVRTARAFMAQDMSSARDAGVYYEKRLVTIATAEALIATTLAPGTTTRS